MHFEYLQIVNNMIEYRSKANKGIGMYGEMTP